MALGIVMLLGFLGINVGWIIALVIPSFFVYQGWKLFTKRESKVKKGFGITLMIVGLLWLTGMLHVLIGLAMAALLIYYGLKMINKNKGLAFPKDVDMAMGEGYTANEFSYKDYDYLDEWEKELTKK